MRYLAALLFAFFAALPAQADARTYSQPELDRMLAPVALYPDSLLSQMLMAATYPEEVAEAAQWARANPGLEGDGAVRAVDPWHDWDPSVKSLVAFPQILQRMDENRDWTRQLGQAFLEQQPHVMDTVQQLRRRAQAAGHLHSTEQLVVQQHGQAILLQPARPEVVYVPYYDPLVVYGPWWHASYPPVAWRPWPGYTRVYHPGVTFWFGRPAYLAPRFFYGGFDWHRRHAHVVHLHHQYHRHAAGRWQHDAGRRRAAVITAAPVQIRQQPAHVQNQPAPVRSAPSQAEQMQRQEYRRREAAQRQNNPPSQAQQMQQVQQVQQPQVQQVQQPPVQQRSVPTPAPAPAPQAVPRSTPAPQVQQQVQREERREHRQERRQEIRQERRQESRQPPQQQQQQQQQRQEQPRHNAGQRENRRG